jgi:predicted ferric reductase
MWNVLQGLFWMGVYLALVLTPLLVLLAVDTPAGLGFWWDFAVALGFAALAMMAVQFVLTARFRRAAAPYGIDIIYFFHRYLAVIALLLVLAHAVVLMIENPFFLQAFNPLAAPRHLFAGAVSAAALLALVTTSLGRKTLRLHYGAWRILHVALAVGAVLLALVHVEGVGYYIASPWKRGVWMLIIASWAAIGLYVRIIKPWLLLRHPYRIVSVTAERGDAWTLTLEPIGHAGFTFEPGQFSWLTLRSSPFAMKEHPFSMSSAPDARGRLEFTIKELGDFTRTVKHIEAGETAYVDGPYGAFTIDRYESPGYVLIGGGIGMAPLLSMLRALAERADRRPHLLVMANSRWERATFWEAVQDLSRRINLRVVHVLEEPPEQWTGERGYVTLDILGRHLPENRGDVEYFICGPIPMIRAVERALYALGVPLGRCHSELFDLV